MSAVDVSVTQAGRRSSRIAGKLTARRALVPVAWLALVVVAFLLPYLVTGPELIRLQQVMYTAVAVMSLNVLSGLSGQISIGQSAYVGLAAYTTAILVENQGWSYWAALPVAVVLAALLGVLTGLPALRITGIRLALATLAIAIVFPTLPVKFSGQTGGTPGMNVTPLSAPDSLAITTVAYNYWVELVIVVLLWIVIRNVVKSRIGRSLLAIRDHQTAAYTVGINVAVTKVLVFGASAAMCGITGWMFVVTNQFVAPVDFTVLLAIYLLVGMAIGGAGSLVGPVFGGLFVVYAPQEIARVGASPLLTPVIYGVVLILILFLLPQGVGGLLAKLARRIVGPPPSTRPRAGGTDDPGDGHGDTPADDDPGTPDQPAADPSLQTQPSR